jgi:hypothetical protein
MIAALVTPWPRAFARALLSGSAAALVSSLALALTGRRETGSALAPINAVSHWLWGRRSARQDDASVTYTLTGYLTHHAASIFWAVFFERLFGRRAGRTPAQALASGAAIAALAATVDYTITPKRFTPGYEARLSRPSLVAVYAAFALGLALAGTVRGERR